MNEGMRKIEYAGVTSIACPFNMNFYRRLLVALTSTSINMPHPTPIPNVASNKKKKSNVASIEKKKHWRRSISRQPIPSSAIDTCTTSAVQKELVYVGNGGGVGWGMLTFAGIDVMKLTLPC